MAPDGAQECQEPERTRRASRRSAAATVPSAVAAVDVVVVVTLAFALTHQIEADVLRRRRRVASEVRCDDREARASRSAPIEGEGNRDAGLSLVEEADRVPCPKRACVALDLEDPRADGTARFQTAWCRGRGRGRSQGLCRAAVGIRRSCRKRDPRLRMCRSSCRREA